MRTCGAAKIRRIFVRALSFPCIVARLQQIVGKAHSASPFRSFNTCGLSAEMPMPADTRLTGVDTVAETRSAARLMARHSGRMAQNLVQELRH
jgi:hypothetical protein